MKYREDEILDEIIRARITGAPISYSGFPGYGVAPASGLSVAPGAIIDQGLSVAPGGGITTIKPTTPDGDTADFAYTTKTPKTINITNPYSGGSGGVQSNFGSSSGGGGPSYSGMGSIGSGGASKSKSSSPTNVGNPFGYK